MSKFSDLEIKNINELMILVKAHPEDEMEIWEQILKTHGLSKIAHNGYTAILIPNIFKSIPRETIINEILNDRYFLGKILFNVSNLETLINAFQDNRIEIIEVILDSQILLRKVTMNYAAYQVESLINFLPEYKERITSRLQRPNSNEQEYSPGEEHIDELSLAKEEITPPLQILESNEEHSSEKQLSVAPNRFEFFKPIQDTGYRIQDMKYLL